MKPIVDSQHNPAGFDHSSSSNTVTNNLAGPPPRFHLPALDRWARKGMESSRVALDKVHEDFGLPAFGLGSWRRVFIRACREATLLLAVIASVHATFLTLLPKNPETELEKTTSLLIHCALMLDLAGTILSYFVSQFGDFLDDEIYDPHNNTKETMEQHLFRSQPFIYRLAIWLMSFLIASCSINTSLGAIFFFCGFLMYLWGEKPRLIADALISVVTVLATPILLHMGVCIVILAGVTLAWLRIKWEAKDNNDEREGRGDMESNEG